MAISIWNHCANGMGAVQWAGVLPTLVLLGVPEAETEMMLHLLDVIRGHEPQTPAKD